MNIFGTKKSRYVLFLELHVDFTNTITRIVNKVIKHSTLLKIVLILFMEFLYLNSMKYLYLYYINYHAK